MTKSDEIQNMLDLSRVTFTFFMIISHILDVCVFSCAFAPCYCRCHG